MKLWAVGTTRNEADIIAANVRYHRAQGVTHFLWLDDGSTDETPAILETLSRDVPLEWRRHAGAFEQDRLLTMLVREAFVRGADWVLPLDADEFWYAPGSTLHEALGSATAAALRVRVVNYVQRREQDAPAATALRTMTRRVASPVGPPERIAELVEREGLPYVATEYPSKWVARACPSLEIGPGNHSLAGVAGPVEDCGTIVCLHAPLRARSALYRKADTGRSDAQLNGYLRDAWHVRRWRRLAAESRLDEEWNANSYAADDTLDDAAGRSPALVVDTTLVDLATPFLQDAAVEVARGATAAASEPAASFPERRPFGDRHDVWGVLVVDGATPSLRAMLSHHLSLGVTHVLVATRSALASAEPVLAEHPRVECVPWDLSWTPSRMRTALAREAFRRGAAWVLPLEPGRLWMATDRLETALRDVPFGGLACLDRDHGAPSSTLPWVVRATPHVRYDEDGLVSGWSGEIGRCDTLFRTTASDLPAGIEFAAPITDGGAHVPAPATAPVHRTLAPASRAAILDRARTARGWLSDDEADLLLDAVQRVVDACLAHTVVEVGSYCGRSTMVLAGGLAELGSSMVVHAIDPHQGVVGAVDGTVGLAQEDSTFAEFASNLMAGGLDRVVTPIRQHSFDVEWSRPISLLFIDGLHDFESVEHDGEVLLPWIVEGGLVAFHDCSDLFPGVVRYVQQLEASGAFRRIAVASTLVVLQRERVSMTETNLPWADGQGLTTSDGDVRCGLQSEVRDWQVRVANLEAQASRERARANRLRALRAAAFRRLTGADPSGRPSGPEETRRAAIVEALDTALRAARADDAALRRELDRHGRLLLTAEGALAEARAEARDLRAVLQRALAASDAELAATRQALADRQGRVEALLASASWRVTAPLRAAYDVWQRAASTALSSTSVAAGEAAGTDDVCMPEDDEGTSRLLVVTERVPTPDRDAGSVRLMHMLTILRGMGHEVTLISDAEEGDAGGRQALASLGIDVVYGAAAADEHLSRQGRHYRAVLVSRPDVALKYLFPIRAEAVRARVIYDTVDLHWVRMSRGAELTGDAALREQADYYRRIEWLSMQASDAVITVTEAERDILRDTAPELPVHVVPTIHVVQRGTPGWEQRSGLVFIGGFFHQPNVDAVQYFVTHVLPIVQRTLADVRFTIIGSEMPESIASMASETVRPVGLVADVGPLFDSARVFVAPLRYGAGMKGKIGHAMSHGLPVVTTSIGAEGMDLVDGDTALVADDPEAFAAAVIRLHDDRSLWEHVAARALARVEDAWSERAAEARLAAVFPLRSPDATAGARA